MTLDHILQQEIKDSELWLSRQASVNLQNRIY
jgi:hypothetical protein